MPHNIMSEENSFRSTLRIAIIGGGLGGLAAALALQREGFNVTVYERDVQFSDRKQGYGLTLTNNPKGPLAKLGILDKVLEMDCCSNQHWVFQPSGEICGYYGRALKDKSRNSDANESFRGNIRIPRQELRRILLEQLSPGTVKWGHKLLSYEDNNDNVTLVFENTSITIDSGDQQLNSKQVVMTADIVVGADGIHSKVRQSRDSQNMDLNPQPLQYTGVSVIIGLSTARHPLLKNGGFYVLDGAQRLFVMPFQEESSCTCVENRIVGMYDSDPVPGSTVGKSPTLPCQRCGLGRPQLTMWQLSFASADQDPALALGNLNREALLKEALRRTTGWLEPVQDLVRHTLPDEAAVWGTKIYDRDPMILRPKHKQQVSKRKRGTGEDDSADAADANNPSSHTTTMHTELIHSSSYARSSRITVLGDACHPMTMFKGQGCNQAMEDGPLLASWLGRPGLSADNLFTRLRCFEREMISRTTPKVTASRQAAQLYHSEEALGIDFGFEGLTSAQSAELVAALKRENITAALAELMEPAVIQLVDKIKASDGSIHT